MTGLDNLNAILTHKSCLGWFFSEFKIKLDVEYTLRKRCISSLFLITQRGESIALLKFLYMKSAVLYCKNQFKDEMEILFKSGGK